MLKEHIEEIRELCIKAYSGNLADKANYIRALAKYGTDKELILAILMLYQNVECRIKGFNDDD